MTVDEGMIGQQTPTFLALGTCFVEHNFSTDWGWDVSGLFKHITFIMHFISIKGLPW